MIPINKSFVNIKKNANCFIYIVSRIRAITTLSDFGLNIGRLQPTGIHVANLGNIVPVKERVSTNLSHTTASNNSTHALKNKQIDQIVPRETAIL